MINLIGIFTIITVSFIVVLRIAIRIGSFIHINDENAEKLLREKEEENERN